METTPAQLLALLAALFAVFASTLYLIKRFRRAALSRQRQCLAQDLHDEIGASLSNISLLSALAERGIPAGESNQNSIYLHRISEEANKVHDTISDTIKMLDPEYRQLQGLTALLTHHAQEVFRYQPLDFSINLAEQIKHIRIKTSYRRDFYLILKESLHNIARHAQATEAEIEFREENGELHCRIRDNGCGFDPATTAGSNGLRNMARRARRIGGRLIMDTRPGKGTQVHLMLPLSAALHWKLKVLRGINRIGHIGATAHRSDPMPEFISGTS